MDPDLEERLAQRMLDLASSRRITDSSAKVYSEKLHAWWRPYATTRDLPCEFGGADARPLTAPELMALIGAASTGVVRRLTREGARERDGEPLSVPSLDGLFAALRDAHLRAGLDWRGNDALVREVRLGYARAHGVAQHKAKEMKLDDVVAMFGSLTSAPLTPTTSEARARSVALALGLPVRDLPAVAPEAVTVHPTEAVVRVRGRCVSIPCLRSVVADDLVAEAACAHCALRDWLDVGAPHALLPAANVDSFVRRMSRWVVHVPGARLDGGVLTADAGDPWTMVALGLPLAAQEWVRARAVLLPMRVVGLRLDDIDGLTPRDVRIEEDHVTLSVVGKTESAARPYAVTLDATWDALCPVTAVRTYEAWVRAHGCAPDRPQWMLPLRGKAAFRYPTDVPVSGDGRALYQSIRLWLAEQGAGLTPHSARRGFATQARADGYETSEIQHAMRHKRISTTLGYVDGTDDGAARRVLDAIAEERPRSNG